MRTAAAQVDETTRARPSSHARRAIVIVGVLLGLNVVAWKALQPLSRVVDPAPAPVTVSPSAITRAEPPRGESLSTHLRAAARSFASYLEGVRTGATKAELEARARQAGNALRPCVESGRVPDLGVALYHAWCVRQAGMAAAVGLDAMQEVEYRYLFRDGPGGSLAIFVAQCDDPNRPQPRVVRQVLRDYFSAPRAAVFAERAAPLLGSLAGRSVADIGCGIGVRLPWLVERVGPGGTVWAEDQDDDVFGFIRFAAANGFPDLRRVRTVTGSDVTVGMSPATIDVAVLDDIHANQVKDEDLAGGGSSTRLESGLRWLASIRAALRSGGRIVILEDGRAQPRCLSLEGTRRFLARGGFEIERVVEHRDPRAPAGAPAGFSLSARRLER